MYNIKETNDDDDHFTMLPSVLHFSLTKNVQSLSFVLYLVWLLARVSIFVGDFGFLGGGMNANYARLNKVTIRINDKSFWIKLSKGFHSIVDIHNILLCFSPVPRGCRSNSNAWGPRRSNRAQTRTCMAAPHTSAHTQPQADRAEWTHLSGLTGTRATRHSETRLITGDRMLRLRLLRGTITIWTVAETQPGTIIPSRRSRPPQRRSITRSDLLWRSGEPTSNRNRDTMWVQQTLYATKF